MDNKEESPKHLKVAVVGAPCSGKTSTLQSLRALLYRFPNEAEYECAGLNPEYWQKVDKAFLREEDGCGLLEEDPDFFPFWVIDEAWRDYQFIAPLLFQLLSGQISLEEAQLRLPSINLNHDDYYSPRYTVRDLAADAQLVGLASRPQHMIEARRTLQQELFRVQVHREYSPRPSWMQNRLSVTAVDGGLLNIVAYNPDMQLSDYPAALRKAKGIVDNQQLLGSYYAIILLETLVNLAPPAYEKYYFGRDRLDTPDEAKKMHVRLEALTADHPRVLRLPARMEYQDKCYAMLDYMKGLLVGK